MSRFYSQRLGAQDRSAFRSGNARIDRYFHAAVSQDVKRDYAACYVLMEKGAERLAGFYTLSSSNVPLSDIPAEFARKLPRYPSVPAVLIGWLARDAAFEGQGVGPMLLYDAIARVLASPVGAHAIFADAIDDAAAAFYRRHRFTPLASRPMTLFLPLSTARRLI